VRVGLLRPKSVRDSVERCRKKLEADRERPPEDRRVVKVHLTPTGLDTLNAARAIHRHGIQEHFVSHIDPANLETLADALQGVREHVRPLRPGRISR
jgi:DNA-binding MarR family transcriptional regulator